VLIFVFAGVSCGRARPILAEFAPVPNAPSELVSSSATDDKTAAVPTAGPVKCAEKAARVEIGGPQGPEPTRFGDWEKNGRCVDF
jgi:hypothetical protein